VESDLDRSIFFKIEYQISQSTRTQDDRCLQKTVVCRKPLIVLAFIKDIALILFEKKHIKKPIFKQNRLL